MGRNWLTRWGSAVAIATVIAACGASRAAPTPGPASDSSPPPGASPAPTPASDTPVSTALPLRALGSGPMSGLRNEMKEIVRDQAAWQALWQRHDADEAPPAVDFASEMVAVVVQPRNTGGYRVVLEGARLESGRLVITYSEIAPGPYDVVIQVLTQPWAFAALPRRDEPATFIAR